MVMNARVALGSVRRPVLVLLSLLVLTPLSAGCKDTDFLIGKWLLLTPDGKPGSCYEFKADETFTAYPSIECSGEPDPLLSGRWELKEANKLAIQQRGEQKAQLALITEKAADKIVMRGAISGGLYKLGEGGGVAVLKKLEWAKVLKVRAMPKALGCKQLSMTLEEIRALPKEPDPVMLRQKDQALEYHQKKPTGNPQLDKEVFALTGEAVDWISLHFTTGAFEEKETELRPYERLEAALGKPEGELVTGEGEKTQKILMWRAYCASLKGATNKDVDATFFYTPGEKRGILYVSESVLKDIWEDLRHLSGKSAPAPTPAPEPKTEPK
jgi:hypothetical protein